MDDILGTDRAKRQAEAAGIAFEPLDNGFLSCEDPKGLNRLCGRLGPVKIDVLVRKWLRILPHPFTAADRRAGYRYDISILQAEFSLPQALDRSLSGRVFFEEVIHDNLDLGRPDQVAPIFSRRVSRRTPGGFRTRVLTEGVVPSLHVDYKKTKIKQYHKLGKALRTETTINDARDFGVGKRLHNLPALREVGFSANRRLLEVQRTSCDCQIGEEAFATVCAPVVVERQRGPALRFGDPRVQALLSVLVVFRLLPDGFSNRDLRMHLAPLLGTDPAHMTPGRMTYDLRRLHLHGIIERIPHTHRYRVTSFGLRVAMLFTRTYARVLRPGLAHSLDPYAVPTAVRRQFDRLDDAIDDFIAEVDLAA